MYCRSWEPAATESVPLEPGRSNHQLCSLKGQCYESFDFYNDFFKDLPGPHMNWQTVSRFFFAKIFAINVYPHSHVCVIDDYADTTMTTWTPKANFEGFSKIVKEQSDKKSTCVCLHTQYYYYFKKKKMGSYLRLKLCVHLFVDYADA